MSRNANGTPSGALFDALSSALDSANEQRGEFVQELLNGLREAGDRELSEWLLEYAGHDVQRRLLLAGAIGRAARAMEPSVDKLHDEVTKDAWQAMVTFVDRMYGSEVQALGRLPFLSDTILGLLSDEAERQQPESPNRERRETAPAGDILAGLAVSLQLRNAISHALGFAVVPSYLALYEYDHPSSHVGAHLDSGDAEFVVHLLVQHEVAGNNTQESVLAAYFQEEPRRREFSLRQGEAVVLRGRGTLHSWKALGERERRVLTAIGFVKGPDIETVA